MNEFGKIGGILNKTHAWQIIKRGLYRKAMSTRFCTITFFIYANKWIKKITFHYKIGNLTFMDTPQAQKCTVCTRINVHIWQMNRNYNLKKHTNTPCAHSRHQA